MNIKVQDSLLVTMHRSLLAATQTPKEKAPGSLVEFAEGGVIILWRFAIQCD